MPISRLSDSIAKSMRMLADIHSFKDTLPGIDCGSCGAPTCRAFAEDVIKGLANTDGCPIKALNDIRRGKDTQNDSN